MQIANDYWGLTFERDYLKLKGEYNVNVYEEVIDIWYKIDNVWAIYKMIHESEVVRFC